MTRETFQKKWGDNWKRFTESEMWHDAVATVEQNEISLKTTQLSRDDIRVNGALILSEQQGFLRYANALEKLSVTFEFKQLEPEYPDPAREAHQEAHPPKPKRGKPNARA